MLRPLDTKQQTVCHFWSQGQIEKLARRITGMPKNSVVGVKHHREGLCERLELMLRNGTSVFVDSAERVGRRLHPNRRFQIATATVGGWNPASAHRGMCECGLAGTPSKTKLMAFRQDLLPIINRLANESIKKWRLSLSAAAIANEDHIMVGDRCVASILAHIDGQGSKRSYGSYHTGEGVAVALMDDTGKVIGMIFKQNNDARHAAHRRKALPGPAPGTFRNHRGSVTTAESHAAFELGRRQMEEETPLHVAMLISDGDVNNPSSFTRGQLAGGLSEDQVAEAGGAVCHDMKVSVQPPLR